MKRIHHQSRSFSRRTVLIGGLQGVGLLILLQRMHTIQITQHAHYHTLSNKNRITVKPIVPGRGIIFDRSNHILADLRNDYKIVLERTNPALMRDALHRLERLIPISPEKKYRLLAAFEKSPDKRFSIAEYISWNQMARVSVHIAELPGVEVVVEKSRFYTVGNALSHVLGHVGKDTRAKDAIAEEKIGIIGMEKQFNRQLRGTKGTRTVEVDAHGREIRNLNVHAAKRGDPLKLSLDAGLQGIATARLRDKTASAVVLDCRSGEVLAMVSSPGFNPNAFSRGLTHEQWRSINTDPRLPMLNRASAGQYAPGSTFKMIVALAALAGGKIDADRSVFCPGHFDFGNQRFHCWKKHGHGLVDMNKALRESCDVYFYQAALHTGIQAITNMGRRFGLGRNWSTIFPGCADGLMPDPGWKKRSIGQPWFEGETVIAGIGQGYILTTPLQLAVMTARMVNGGTAVVPRFTPLGEGETPSFPSIDVPARFLDIIHRGMEEVVNHPQGTAHQARINDKNWRMGGKTGTSQVRRISKEERENNTDPNDVPYRFRDHALFVGYAPLHYPRIVAAAVVEHGGAGSKVAAPIVRDLLTYAQSIHTAERK